ncbi:DNA topoisomerase IV subunit A [Simkania negevensis]|uniref:DNA topoisomerase IV subunit A n=1 Tax=Simkania negevensis TaxID=83561 RepID=A0ABS3AS86_9BACT|nr:DNA topoisomerase IV subunit A [Simkania negevensis]
MDDLKYLMRDNYIKYASYVILERAIPHVADGLKPVQRRILQTLYKIDDGKLHKVANVSGQTMALHPHGEAAINDALVTLANKGFLLDQQGNFGNPHTGDPHAAPRYIETRLLLLAKETMFNPDLTTFLPSYDGRNKEPAVLPAKVPILLMQGAEGIAVGMATRILPHNFVELLQAEIAILQGRSDYTILPDFPTGGIMDASQYDFGRGKVKLRARLEIKDKKAIIVKELCYGTTTDSLVKSIAEAAKKGKIKVDTINDYTAEKVEIEIVLPRGVYAEETIDALYAFTECEVDLSSQVLAIKDGLPWETDVNEILHYHVEQLQGYLQKELEIERERALEKIFNKTLEEIFIDNRVYKKIEDVVAYEKIHEAIEEGLKPYHKKLERVPTYDDRERLLSIPIRRISRFDIEKNRQEIKALNEKVVQVEKNLKSIKRYSIKYIKGLISKYGKGWERKTVIEKIDQIDKRVIAVKDVKVGFDIDKGFVGTKISAETSFECKNIDKIFLLYQDGSYSVINIPDKQYVAKQGVPLVYLGVADKEKIFRVAYRDPKTGCCYVKRFVIDKFIVERKYRFFDEGMALEYLTTQPNLSIEFKFKQKARQKIKSLLFDLDTVLVKGVKARGIRVANKEVRKVVLSRKQTRNTKIVV